MHNPVKTHRERARTRGCSCYTLTSVKPKVIQLNFWHSPHFKAALPTDWAALSVDLSQSTGSSGQSSSSLCGFGVRYGALNFVPFFV